MEIIESYITEFRCGQKKEIIIARCSCGKTKHIQKQRFLKLKPNATCGNCPDTEKVQYIAVNSENKEVNTFMNYQDAIDYAKITLTQIIRVSHSPIVYD